MQIRRFLWILISAWLCLSLCACDGGYKADGSFTYILPQNISTLDPQTATGYSSGVVISSLFEGLCCIDEEGQATPGVAHRWEKNEDATEFTFHLRGNAQWSNGADVTADDFIFALQRALRPETAAPGVDDLFLIKNARGVYAGSVSEEELGVYARDERTLVIQLEQSYEDFPALTAGLHFMPCNRAYFEESAGHYGLSSQYLISNGPFTFSTIYSWNTDSGSRSLGLSRNSYYNGEEKVLPASLTFLIDYDESIDADPVTALTEGSVDILTLPEDEMLLAQEQGCQVEILNDAVTGLLLNPNSETLSSVELRRIFIETLNRSQLLSRRDDPESAGAAGIMPSCVLWNGQAYYGDGTEIFLRQDDTAADGLSSLLTRLEMETTPSITVICPDDPESINVANGFLVDWNSKLGNAFNIQPLPEEELEDRIFSGDYEAALYTLQAGGTSPYAVLKSFLSTASPTLMSDESYDQALRARSFDLNAYMQLETHIMNNAVFYPLFADSTYYVSGPDVKDISVSPNLGVDFTQATKK